MTLDKFAQEWAETGDVLEPSVEKQAVGWVSGTNADRPSVEYLNYLQNRVEKKIDEVIEERLASHYLGATDPEKQISTGLHTNSWGCTHDAANVIEGGATKEYIDLAVYFFDGQPRLLALDTAGTQHIDVYDARAMTLLDTSDSLRDDLPSGSSETWEAESMCTDGTYIYIVFTDTHLSSGSRPHRIQAWRISDWSVKTGWPATGTALTGTGISPHLVRNAYVIVASDTKLAVAAHWITITAASSAALQIIDIADGSLDASGSGDAPTGDGAEIGGQIASDGTNIFFGTIGGSDNEICTATIADPQAGSGGSGYPHALSASAFQHYVCACGPKCIVSTIAISGDAITDLVLHSHNSSAADLDMIIRGQNSWTSPVSNSELIMDQPKRMVFDGINLWILVCVGSVAVNIQYALVKVDIGKLSLYDTAYSYKQMNDITSACYFVSPDTTDTMSDLVAVVFDGRDIWCVIEPLASAPNSGKIFRLPLALLRS